LFELLIAVGTVIIVSAMCSLFEAVLYSIPSSFIEALDQSGKRSGRILKDLRFRRVDRPIAAILSLNTIANTGGAFIAGAAFLKVYGSDSSLYFTIALTLAVLLLSEIIPKTVGVTYCRQLASFTAFPLLLMVWIFSPLVELARMVTRLFSADQTEDEITKEEILAMAQLGRRTGVIDPNEARLMENILQLKERTVREAMTPRNVIFALDASLTLKEAQEKTGIWAYSRVPVYAEGFEDMVGIVLRRDALNALAEDPESVKLSQLMKPVHFVAESFSLDKVLQMFLNRRQHLFIVIDEYGGLSGILTLEDILEEILGREIVDEFDTVTDMQDLARVRRRQVLEGE
jgi:CBS domain containing-hemolysin-like protein